MSRKNVSLFFFLLLVAAFVPSLAHAAPAAPDAVIIDGCGFYWRGFTIREDGKSARVYARAENNGTDICTTLRLEIRAGSQGGPVVLEHQEVINLQPGKGYSFDWDAVYDFDIATDYIGGMSICTDDGCSTPHWVMAYDRRWDDEHLTGIWWRPVVEVCGFTDSFRNDPYVTYTISRNGQVLAEYTQHREILPGNGGWTDTRWHELSEYATYPAQGLKVEIHAEWPGYVHDITSIMTIDAEYMDCAPPPEVETVTITDECVVASDNGLSTDMTYSFTATDQYGEPIAATGELTLADGTTVNVSTDASGTGTYTHTDARDHVGATATVTFGDVSDSEPLTEADFAACDPEPEATECVDLQAEKVGEFTYEFTVVGSGPVEAGRIFFGDGSDSGELTPEAMSATHTYAPASLPATYWASAQVKVSGNGWVGGNACTTPIRFEPPDEPEYAAEISGVCPTPFRLSNDLALTASVTADGEPAAGLAVELALPNGQVKNLVTRSDGSISFTFEGARAFVGQNIDLVVEGEVLTSLTITEAMFESCTPPEPEPPACVGIERIGDLVRLTMSGDLSNLARVVLTASNGGVYALEPAAQIEVSVPGAEWLAFIVHLEYQDGAVVLQPTCSLDGRDEPCAGNGVRVFLYHDANSNGSWDAGELPLGGEPVDGQQWYIGVTHSVGRWYGPTGHNGWTAWFSPADTWAINGDEAFSVTTPAWRVDEGQIWTITDIDEVWVIDGSWHEPYYPAELFGCRWKQFAIGVDLEGPGPDEPGELLAPAWGISRSDEGQMVWSDDHVGTITLGGFDFNIIEVEGTDTSEWSKAGLSRSYNRIGVHSMLNATGIDNPGGLLQDQKVGDLIPVELDGMMIVYQVIAIDEVSRGAGWEAELNRLNQGSLQVITCKHNPETGLFDTLVVYTLSAAVIGNQPL